MSLSRPVILVAAAVLALNGCGGERLIRPSGPVFAVSDGAHNGNRDFFFLSPLFKNASQSPNFEPAAFNPFLKPAVQICELTLGTDGSRECVAGDPVKRFGPADVAMSLAGQLYQANWHTDESNLDLTKLYRISVLVGTRVLGFVDVDPVLNGKEIKNLDTGEDIPLVDGRTLPIKFRIEDGALCGPDVVACATQTIDLTQGGTVQLLASGEDFRLDVPPNTAATIAGLAVNLVTFNLETCQGIAVDLPKVGQCLRVSTFFEGLGVGELVFSNRLLISMCMLNSHYDVHQETPQEGLITLHQQDGPLIRALPHAEPNCATANPSGGSRSSADSWQWLKDIAGLLLPRPAYAATISRTARTTLLHVGAGGESGALGSSCSSASSAVTPNQATCASSPAVSGPASSSTIALALIDPARTVSDFQFALPAKMDYVDPSDAVRSASAGTTLPTLVKVTDAYGAPVQGARVHFLDVTGLEITSALSDANGIAQYAWTISAGANAIAASGRGIAAANNYPGGTVKPFMPDISVPTDQQQAVVVQTGLLTFVATGVDVDLLISGTPTVTPSSVLPGVAVLLASWTISNRGATDVLSAVTSDFYLSTDPVITSSDVRLGSIVTLPALLTAGHGVTLGGQALVIPATTRAGSYYIGILVDPTNAQAESNEQNNSASTPLTVRSPIGLP